MLLIVYSQLFSILNFVLKSNNLPKNSKKRCVFKQILYMSHYNPWFVYFYPIFHCGLYCRAVYNAERLIFHDSFLSSNLYKEAIQVATKKQYSTYYVYTAVYAAERFVETFLSLKIGGL